MKHEFGISFSTSIPANEIALAKLRLYYSWPNIRTEPFGEILPNNCFTFSYNKDGNQVWKVILPTGTYKTEQINEEIQSQIKAITLSRISNRDNGSSSSVIFCDRNKDRGLYGKY